MHAMDRPRLLRFAFAALALLAAGTASAAERTQPQPQPQEQSELVARYAAAMRGAVLAQWLRPADLGSDSVCRVRIRQLPGGQIVNVEVMDDCPWNDAGRTSIERAVYKAQPLPYAGFERVFSRDLILRVSADPTS